LTIEDAGHLTFTMGKEELTAISSIACRFIAYVWFSSWFKNRTKKRTIETHRRKYAGNYILTYVKGDSREFDFGVDYIECASCKFLQAESAFELAPYVCAVDMAASELLGWGLRRTMTLAEGGERCDFRLKKGGKTYLPLPQSLR
jgi:hypothetical protein